MGGSSLVVVLEGTRHPISDRVGSDRALSNTHTHRKVVGLGVRDPTLAVAKHLRQVRNLVNKAKK